MVYLGSIRRDRRFSAYGLSPDVLDFSLQDYMLQSPDVTFRPLLETARYRYRYEGLRLLTQANDRFFLVPARSGTDLTPRAIALPDQDSIRVDISRSPDDREAICP